MLRNRSVSISLTIPMRTGATMRSSNCRRHQILQRNRSPQGPRRRRRPSAARRRASPRQSPFQYRRVTSTGAAPSALARGFGDRSLDVALAKTISQSQSKIKLSAKMCLLRSEDAHGHGRHCPKSRATIGSRYPASIPLTLQAFTNLSGSPLTVSMRLQPRCVPSKRR